MPYSAPGLPPGGQLDQVLKITEPAPGKKKPEWTDPEVQAQLFRGEWGPDELAKQYGFENGIPAEFQTAAVNGASLPIASAVNPGSPWTASVLLKNNNIWTQTASKLILPLSALKITGITRITAKMMASNQYYNQARLYKNGTLVWSANDAVPWTDISTTCDSDDVIEFWGAGRFSSNAGGSGATQYVTAIKVFAAAQPYMLGEYVTHKGKMWRSLIDTNSGEPGVAATWEHKVDLPNKVGTTAQRPAPATAGAGYNFFDTTLNKPIWVNAAATGWVDSTGTAVV